VDRRMSRGERREQILDAAMRVFADGGYAGTSTDQVARAAGVSQPYVVRLFGTKRDLFQTLFERVSARIVQAFEAVEPGPDAAKAMGDAYVRLLDDRDMLRVLMHGFVAASDPELGRSARSVLARVFDLYRERTGGTPDEAREFVARGMLINVLLAAGAVENAANEPAVADLLSCVVGEELAARMTAEVA
jgi:AcrR family transcriptional regulator